MKPKFNILTIAVILFSTLSCKNEVELKADNKPQFSSSVEAFTFTTPTPTQVKALEEFENNTAKYYFPRIAIAPKKYVEATKAYDLELITTGCALTTYEQEYNSAVERAFYHKHNINIMDLFN